MARKGVSYNPFAYLFIISTTAWQCTIDILPTIAVFPIALGLFKPVGYYTPKCEHDPSQIVGQGHPCQTFLSSQNLSIKSLNLRPRRIIASNRPMPTSPYNNVSSTAGDSYQLKVT